MIISALVTITAALQMAQVPSSYIQPMPAATTVLAKVNGVPIRASDVDKLLWDYSGFEIAQDLITYQVIHQEAAKLKLTVTPAEVQAAYDAFVAEQKPKLQPGQDLDTMLRQQGLPKVRLKMQIESNLLLNKIVDAKFKPGDYVKVSTLVFTPKSASATDLQETLGKAQDAYNRLMKGEDWDKVLQSSGQSPELLQHKGLLGWRSKEAFPPLTQAEFKTTKAGGILKPVQTNGAATSNPANIQLFRAEAFGTDAKGDTLKELKALYEQSAKKNLLQEMQKSAKVDQIYWPTAKH